MTTITLLLAISANILGVAALLMTISSHKNVHQIEEVNAPKPKRGRPRKNAPKPHTIVHELGN